MTDKVQLIKEEIERRIGLLNKVCNNKECETTIAYKDILNFIDSLPEEPTDETIKENYHERYKRIAQTEQFKKSYCDKSLGKEESGCEVNCTTKNEDLEEEIKNWIKTKHFVFTEIDEVIETAKHFAEWQKQRDQETIELAEEHAMLAGMNKMKEEMMKDAVEANVYQGLYSKYVKERDDEALANVLKNYNSGDKVKIIICKTEQP